METKEAAGEPKPGEALGLAFQRDIGKAIEEQEQNRVLTLEENKEYRKIGQLDA